MWAKDQGKEEKGKDEKPEKKRGKGKKEDDGYDPWEHREVEKPNSDLATFFHLVKAAVGTGVLTIPICYFRSGLVPGLLYAGLVTCLTLYCTHILVRTQYNVAKRNEIPYAPYGFTMNDCFTHGPPCFKKIARLGEVLVDIFICLFHLGTLTVYIAFISASVLEVFELKEEISIRMMIVYVSLGLIIFVVITHMLVMTIVSIIGAILLVVCFGFLFYYIFRPDDIGYVGAENPRYFGSIPEGPIIIGAMLFGTQTLGVILALDEKMKKPQHLLGWRGVFPVTTIFIVFLYTFVGILGYLKYGDEVKSSLSLNLPIDEIMAKVIIGGFALSVACSFPIHIFPPVLIIWRKYTEPNVKEGRNPCNILEYVIRISLLIVCTVLAVLIPMIDILTSMVGSLTLSVLGVFFPALSHYCYWWSVRDGKISALMCLDIFLMCLGIFLIGITTYANILSMETSK